MTAWVKSLLIVQPSINWRVGATKVLATEEEAHSSVARRSTLQLSHIPPPRYLSTYYSENRVECKLTPNMEGKQRKQANRNLIKGTRQFFKTHK